MPCSPIIHTAVMPPSNEARLPFQLRDPAMIAATHLAAADAARRVLGALESAGVPAIPVKGILTARLLYDGLEQRPIRDVDLRVRPADLPAALAVARAQKWEILGRMPVYGSATIRAYGVPFDLETHVGAPFMSGLTVSAMLARATRRNNPLGFAHYHPEIHDHALLLCLNVYKDHLIEAADWAVRDLQRIITHPLLQPLELTRRAEFVGNATMLHVVASWLVHVKGIAAWQCALTPGNQPPRQYYAYAMTRLVSRAPGPHPHLLRLLSRQGSDRRAYRLAAVASMAAFGVLHQPWKSQAVSRAPVR